MLALALELLTGRYVATQFNDRDLPEWPPHPARLYSALVATHYASPDPPPEERAALEWLEQLPPPIVLASAKHTRTVSNVYVPVGDATVLTHRYVESRLDQTRDAQEEASAARAELETARERGETNRIAELEEQVEQAMRALHRRVSDLEERAREYARGRGSRNPGPDDALSLLPQHRNRQPRKFPSVKPDIPRVVMAWEDAEADLETHRLLDRLVSRLSRLGHSSSLVSAHLLESLDDLDDELERWSPDDASADAVLRVVTEGQLERLDDEYEVHQGVRARVLPASFQRYRRGEPKSAPDCPHGIFGDDWVVFRVVADPNQGRRTLVRLTRTEDLTRSLRDALLEQADPGARPPEVLSGLDTDGDPLERPHVAHIPLADVAHKYATGSVLGLAVVLPRSLDEEERQSVLATIGRLERAHEDDSGQRQSIQLWSSRAGSVRVERVIQDDPRKTLAPWRWTGPSHRWATVTPVALDRHPGDPFSNDPEDAARAMAQAEDTIARSCRYVDLPPPEWVQVNKRSVLEGSCPATDFTFPRLYDGPRRVCVHAEIRFPEKVLGPVLLGAGRYFGLGLFYPVPEETS